MSLSCTCNDDYDWYYDSPEFYQLFDMKKRKRCISCNMLIDIGAWCIKFESYEIDEFGDQKYFSANWMCEECADIFFNLNELGFCITLGRQSMKKLLKEYHDFVNYKNNSFK